MATRIGGLRRKSRHKMSKNYKTKGKITPTKYLQTFENGEKVVLKAEPAIQKGLYELRFHGKIGEVIGQKGKCYIVKIKDGGKEKTLIVHPVHLKKTIKKL